MIAYSALPFTSCRWQAHCRTPCLWKQCLSIGSGKQQAAGPVSTASSMTQLAAARCPACAAQVPRPSHSPQQRRRPLPSASRQSQGQLLRQLPTALCSPSLRLHLLLQPRMVLRHQRKLQRRPTAMSRCAAEAQTAILYYTCHLACVVSVLTRAWRCTQMDRTRLYQISSLPSSPCHTDRDAFMMQ